MEKFARKCNATGCGMNEGYVVRDGELYFSDQEHLVNWLRSRGGMDGLSDEFIMNEAYNEEEYYYTDWDDEDDYNYIMVDGVLTEIETTKIL